MGTPAMGGFPGGREALQHGCGNGPDPLDRGEAPAGLVEGGAQNLVALDQGPEGALQGNPVEAPTQLDGAGHVVARSRLGALLLEPQALLGPGQRDRLIGFPSGDLASAWVLLPGRFDGRSQCGQGRCPKKTLQFELHAELLARPGQEPRRHQGVPPQGEKVRVHKHLFHPEELGQVRR